jgi:hypothetical protein
MPLDERPGQMAASAMGGPEAEVGDEDSCSGEGAVWPSGGGGCLPPKQSRRTPRAGASVRGVALVRESDLSWLLYEIAPAG